MELPNPTKMVVGGPARIPRRTDSRGSRGAWCSSRPAPTCGRARRRGRCAARTRFGRWSGPAGRADLAGPAARRAAGQEPGPYMRGRRARPGRPQRSTGRHAPACQRTSTTGATSARGLGRRRRRGDGPPRRRADPDPPAPRRGVGRGRSRAARGRASQRLWLVRGSNAPDSGGVSPICHAFADARVYGERRLPRADPRPREPQRSSCDALVDRVLNSRTAGPSRSPPHHEGERVLAGRESCSRWSPRLPGVIASFPAEGRRARSGRPSGCPADAATRHPLQGVRCAIPWVERRPARAHPRQLRVATGPQRHALRRSRRSPGSPGPTDGHVGPDSPALRHRPPPTRCCPVASRGA